MDKCKISAFCLTTNNIKYQFPFIESIRSFLPIVDEMIIIDGGSTDGTIEKIKEIGDSKIKIIQDEDTKWEDDWLYWRMGHNFNRGLQECTGDWIIKFDTDYIVHEKGLTRFRDDCINGIKKRKLTISFTRLNYIYANRFYVKSKKTLAVNTVLCKEVGIDLRYGFDLDNWAWGFEFINFKEYKNKINFGKLIRENGNSFVSTLAIHNYDNVFASKEIIKEMRSRHWLAEEKQKAIINEYNFNGKDNSWNHYKKLIESNLKKIQYPMPLEKHPKIIQDKIRNIRQYQQGHNKFNGFN